MSFADMARKKNEYCSHQIGRLRTRRSSAPATHFNCNVVYKVKRSICAEPFQGADASVLPFNRVGGGFCLPHVGSCLIKRITHISRSYLNTASLLDTCRGDSIVYPPDFLFQKSPHGGLLSEQAREKFSSHDY